MFRVFTDPRTQLSLVTGFDTARLPFAQALRHQTMQGDRHLLYLVFDPSM